MRTILILCVLVSTGCAVSLWPPEVAFGGSSVNSGCDENGICSRSTESMPIGDSAFSFLLRVIDAVPGVEVGAADPVAPEAKHHTHPAVEPRVEWETGGPWYNSIDTGIMVR